MANCGRKFNRELSGRQVTDLCCGVTLLLFVLLFLFDPAGLQRDLFYNRGSDLLADFLNSVRHIALGNPYDAGHIQPPLGYLVLLPFTAFADFTLPLSELWKSAGALTAAGVFVALSETVLIFFCCVCALKHGKRALGAVVWLVFSGVNLAAMERGTAVILSAGCIAGFFALYTAEKGAKRVAALFLLSAAGALKIYPALFALVLVKKRDYKALLWCIFFGLLLGVLPFFCFSGGLKNIPRLLENVAVYRETFAFSYVDELMIHVLRNDFFLPGAEKLYVNFRRVVDVIVIFACAAELFGKERVKMSFALACCIALCPAGAMGYTLLYFAVPFIDSYASSDSDRISCVVAFVLALVYTPLRFACQLNLFLPVLLCSGVLLATLIIRVKDFIKSRKTEGF